MYGVNNVNHSPFNYGKKSQPPVQPEQPKSVDEKNTGRKDEILFSSVSRKDESYLSSLSKEAKDYLAKLKEMYPDYDFIIADYDTDEDASRLLSQGKGELNVLITPDLLEKMATDEATRAKYEDIIAGAKEQFEEINKDLTDEAKSMVKTLGITVNEDGTVNFYASFKDGITTADGGKSISSSLMSDFTSMLNSMAAERAKFLEQKDDKPPKAGKEEKKESTMPPKSFEKFHKEKTIYDRKKEPGNLPPESFKKYEKEKTIYDRKKEPGNLPPESFEKFHKEKGPYDTKEDHGNLPPESFKKYQDEDMNFKV